MTLQLPEYWLRGPLPHIITLLQPAAHAMLQAQWELHQLFENFDDRLLWDTPADNASPAFHLQHITGFLDRLFTYAKGEELTNEQLVYLSNEGTASTAITGESLLKNLDKQIEISIRFLETIQVGNLTEVRYVGRKKIQSTTIGLLFHAAEHMTRHTGQLLVTVKMIKNKFEFSYQ